MNQTLLILTALAIPLCTPAQRGGKGIASTLDAYDFGACTSIKIQE